MHVFNISLSKNRIFKLLLIVITLLTLGILFYSIFNIYHEVRHFSVSDNNIPDVINISPSNYTNVLKAITDNPDAYIGKKISFTGYVYRLSDFTENEFVLARDMVISSDYQAVVVGFLSEYPDAKNLKDGEWVEIVGTIGKGEYHGVIPIIKVTSLKQVSAPSDEYVYPPSDTYVPTTSIF